MAADDPHDPGELLPRPDPTKLTTDQLRREISALREVLTARLDGMDRAFEVFTDGLQRTPTEIEKQAGHLKELAWERFAAISEQFKARDEKVEALAVTAAAQLRAALEAADKLAMANNEAAKLANSKTEAAFGEKIKALEDKIEVNTRALDRGEATTTGAAGYRTERRLDTGVVLTAMSVLIGLLFVAIALYTALHSH